MLLFYYSIYANLKLRNYFFSSASFQINKLFTEIKRKYFNCKALIYSITVLILFSRLKCVRK